MKSVSQTTVVRWSGVALALGGVFFAIFMLLHPFDQLEGPVAVRPVWVAAHSFHFLGALFTLLGLGGLYSSQREATGWLGLTGFVLAFIGTAMFVGTGLITAYIWPVIAGHDPSFVEPGGPMFNHPLTSGVTMAPYIFMVLGYLLFGAMALRAGALPRWGLALLMAGIVLFSVPVHPVGPVPWVVRVIGAVVFGSGLVWLGCALWRRAGQSRPSPVA